METQTVHQGLMNRIVVNAALAAAVSILKFTTQKLGLYLLNHFNPPLLTQRSGNETPLFTSSGPQNTGYSVAIAAGSTCEL